MGVACGERQGALRAVATYEDTRPARSLWPGQQGCASQLKEAALVSDGFVAVEQTSYYLKPFLEAGHARGYIAEVEAKEVMFALLPTGSKAQDHSSIAQVIERGCLSSKQHRIAERKGRDQRPKVDALRVVGQVGKRNDYLQ